ncbi:MAG: hydrogenase formation protein HypD [Syntrophobacteraceae bacterium]|nr:hydrogenase formation protein HypD [Syntrophobacteraceae bacterium]
MKYLDEYRDPQLAKDLIEKLRRRSYSKKQIRLMEICGTHTVAIFRSGLKELLPEQIRLISGPGCPVCVTANEDIDRAIWLSGIPGAIIATFGDLARVPGSSSSLHIERSKGADVRIVYATLDALRIARENPGRQVVFIGIGFETTAPTIAAAVQQAARLGVTNFSVFSAHKLLPPAMRALLDGGEVKIDGFICPGHVSIVIGAGAYVEVAQKYATPCVITGFEPLDILQGVSLLIDQVESGRAVVENQYRRAVTREGNVAARKLIDEVFEPVDSTWRGMGFLPKSGLRFRAEWEKFDAAKRFAMPEIKVLEHPGCKCAEVLRGIISPPECGLFRKACSPGAPKGPCMVSSEGTCGAYYRYHRVV